MNEEIEIEPIFSDCFEKGSVIALATSADRIPYVRMVNSFYLDSAFYFLTCGLVNKMKEIETNSTDEISVDWFTVCLIRLEIANKQ